MSFELPNAEGESVEFKAEWTDKVLPAVAAFHNHRGGTLFLGVDDDGKATGLALTDEFRRGCMEKIRALVV